MTELRGLRSETQQQSITLTRIEQELISVVKDGDRRQGVIDDHENRLRVLEAFKWKLIGVGLAAGGVAGAVSALLGRILDK